jgi:cob(I)alamin adenosyltransferase
MKPRGMTHLYYGYGKGKTTAALGLALRAGGCGKQVVIIQFLKSSDTGELKQLALLPNTTVLRGTAAKGFIRNMDEEQVQRTKAIHDEHLSKALELTASGQCDLLILDEALDAYQLGVLDEALFFDLIKNKPAPLELVITGHKPDERIIAAADYVTEMKKIKHPYDLGVKARKGVEF